MTYHIIIDAYLDAYMDNDLGDDITFLTHLLIAQHQRWAIFIAYSHPILTISILAHKKP